MALCWLFHHCYAGQDAAKDFLYNLCNIGRFAGFEGYKRNRA